jgi:hypothetical protein
MHESASAGKFSIHAKICNSNVKKTYPPSCLVRKKNKTSSGLVRAFSCAQNLTNVKKAGIIKPNKQKEEYYNE